MQGAKPNARGNKRYRVFRLGTIGHVRGRGAPVPATKTHGRFGFHTCYFSPLLERGQLKTAIILTVLNPNTLSFQPPQAEGTRFLRVGLSSCTLKAEPRPQLPWPGSGAQLNTPPKPN